MPNQVDWDMLEYDIADIARVATFAIPLTLSLNWLVVYIHHGSISHRLGAMDAETFCYNDISDTSDKHAL